jgi:hypothetical protein
MLAERFSGAPVRKNAGFMPTGLAAWDAEGGLQKSVLTEVCGGSGDGSLILGSILETTARQGGTSALVDASGSFEVADWAPETLLRLIWVDCRDLKPALKAADLLLRDGNCPLIVLDLHGFGAKALRTIPSSTWHRFHRLLEQGTSAFLVLSPQPLVEGAQTRIASHTDWTLSALERPRQQLLESMVLRIYKKGVAPAICDRPPEKTTRTAEARLSERRPGLAGAHPGEVLVDSQSELL